MVDYSQTSIEVRQAIARSDETTGDDLRLLARDSDRTVREAVACNPNTPQEVLLKLGEEFPDEITANPIFNMLLLENLDSQFVRLSLARSSTTSEEAIARLAEIPNEEILCAVARNLKTPLYVLEQLAENPPQLYEYSKPGDFDRLFACIARNPNATEALLESLSEHGGSVCYAIAENPNAPIALLEQFSDWNNAEMGNAILKNPTVSVELLEKLAGCEFDQVSQAVRLHPNVSEEAIAIANFMGGMFSTPVELLEKLSDDPRDHIRLRIAQYSSTPDHILRNLLKDLNKISSLEIFKAVIRHENVSTSTLENLILIGQKVDKRFNFLCLESQHLLGHPLISSAAIDGLANRIPPHEMHHIIRHPKVLKTTINRISENHFDINQESSLVYALCSNPLMPSPMLEKALMSLEARFGLLDLERAIYIQSIDRRVEYILRNPSTPSHLLERYSVYPHHRFRSLVALNPDTPIAILEKLAVDGDRRVRESVAANEKAPLSLLEKLAKDEKLEVRSILARNIHIPITLLEQVFRDNRDDGIICTSIAGNPNTPIAILEELISDNDEPEVHLALAKREDINSLQLDAILEIYLQKIHFPGVNSGYSRLYILHAIVIHWNTSISSLERLLQCAINQVVLMRDKELLTTQANNAEQTPEAYYESSRRFSQCVASAFIKRDADEHKQNLTQLIDRLHGQLWDAAYRR